MNPSELKNWIKAKAHEMGFIDCRFAKADPTHQNEFLENWIKKGFHGSMSWMENNIDKRLDPTLLVPGAKTIVILADSYYNSSPANHPIAMYAQGYDYHKVLKDRLYILFNEIKKITSAKGRVFTDSAPVLEHYWAEQAGLGWTGKNTLTLNKKAGSYFFLGELILDLEFPPDSPATRHCGTCTKCIEACPTEALIEPFQLNATKCISYLTIEHKEEFNEWEEKALKQTLFGCDICQDVCPWNRKIEHKKAEAYGSLSYEINKKANLEEILTWDEKKFIEVFKDTPLKRASLKGLKRNIEAYLKNHSGM